MTLRYGFKAEANNLAVQMREELGLRKTDPLPPKRLAAHLDIPVAAFSEYLAAEPRVAALLGPCAEEISALTVHCGSRRIVLVNDSHTPERQNSSLCHELAHGLLLHEPQAALDAHGCRHWNGPYEEEANWLAGVLLIPNEAAWRAKKMPTALAQNHYGVSPQMLTWRLNMSGTRRAKAQR